MNSLTLQLVTDQQTKVFLSSALSEFPFRQPLRFIIQYKLECPLLNLFMWPWKAWSHSCPLLEYHDNGGAT